MSHDPEPPRGRRRRGLTEDERTLWETVARQVKPLRKIQRPVRPHPHPVRDLGPGLHDRIGTDVHAVADPGRADQQR
ncbi:MAG: hypothetical protein ACK5CS_30815, partial [Bradyrhizobium sp.]